MDFKYHPAQLAQLQSLPLDQKVNRALLRIREWLDAWDGDAYVSFSGGKDSLVLAHLVRQVDPRVPLVFVDTGLEYPELKAVVHEWGAHVIRPRLSFRQVLDTYGYPVVSKRVAQQIEDARTTDPRLWVRRHLRLTGRTRDGRYAPSCKIPDRWRFLLDAPFKISARCCDVMKKEPLHAYEQATGRKPIVGLHADESRTRRRSWLLHGCNAFNARERASRPLMIWTNQDILAYARRVGLRLATVYGEIVEDADGTLRTTGVERTGCMFCAFGAHLENRPNRFERMRVTHPALYDYCMDTLGLREVLSYVGIPF